MGAPAVVGLQVSLGESNLPNSLTLCPNVRAVGNPISLMDWAVALKELINVPQDGCIEADVLPDSDSLKS